MKSGRFNLRISPEDTAAIKEIKDLYLEHGIVLRSYRHDDEELSMSEVFRRLLHKHNQVLKSNKLTDAFCMVCLASDHCPGRCKLLNDKE